MTRKTEAEGDESLNNTQILLFHIRLNHYLYDLCLLS